MTTTARPPAWDTLERALHQRRPVQLSYHGRRRIVCPHALGWKNNRAMLLAYQTSSHTPLSQPPQPGWRNLFVDDINDAALTDAATTWQTADNYNAARPFNAIDHVSVAIPSDPPDPLR